MPRTYIQLDEQLYKLTKQRAVADGTSMATVVQRAVARYVTSPAQRPATLERFTFIGSGRSQPGGPLPLSVRHDDALAEDFQARVFE